MKNPLGFIALLLLVLTFCTSAIAQQKDKAETIYFGGHIVTINDAQPTAEALAVKDGKILAIGARAGG